MLQLTNVRLFNRALPTFEHSFAPGRIHVVLGTNQAGKTNLCRLIAGLPCSASGDITFDGTPLPAPRARRGTAAMVYQAFVNYPNLTVAQNIASPLRAQKLSTAQAEARVANLAATLHIDDLLDRLPHELSGGQQQRVAIARALAKRARVLLLDEPLVNLDFKLREALQRELRALLEDQATTVIYTSTDTRDAFSLADELLLLQDGTKLQSGALEDVYAKPQSSAAMALLSDAPLNVLERDGSKHFIRPEHVYLRPPTAPQISFDMFVRNYVTNGNTTYIQGEVENHTWVMRHPGVWSGSDNSNVKVSVDTQDLRRF
ncbi:MAG: ABC transporter ATP-binding protein [Pseudomonadota bacterium]